MWENSMKCLAEVSLQAEPYGQGGGWCCRPPAPRGSRSGSYVGPNELPHNNRPLCQHVKMSPKQSSRFDGNGHGEQKVFRWLLRDAPA